MSAVSGLTAKQAWTACPICSHDMPKGPPSKRRVYCSQLCRNRGISRVRHHPLTHDNTIDAMAVVRLLEGSLVTSTRAERIEAVRVPQFI